MLDRHSLVTIGKQNMACVCWDYEHPCPMENREASRIPYDVPLSVATDLEYKLEEDKFPGLYWSNEASLLIAGMDSTDSGISIPRWSTEMDCTSNLSSDSFKEEIGTNYVDRDLETDSIITLIGEYI